MIEKMQGADLKKEFQFKPSDFGIDVKGPTQGKDPILDSLGEMPQPNPAIIQTAQITPNVMETGLTPSESALLSEEEKNDSSQKQEFSIMPLRFSVTQPPQFEMRPEVIRAWQHRYGRLCV